MGVVDLLKFGIEIVGHLPAVGIWRPRNKPPVCGTRSLWATAPQVQQRVLQYKGGSAEDSEVWKLTLEEEAEGGIRGPFTKEQLDRRLGPRWLAAR